MESKRTSASAMDALKSAADKKAFQSFKDLEKGEYFIEKFFHIDTQHGTRVRVDLTDTYMYLPERYVKRLTEEICAELSKTPKIMIYKGKDPNISNRLILDFKEVEYFGEFFTNDFNQ